jgi:hypothetical protein
MLASGQRWVFVASSICERLLFMYAAEGREGRDEQWRRWVLGWGS